MTSTPFNFINPFGVNDEPGTYLGDFYTDNFAKDAQPGNVILNLGPQHPSTHGVLRVLVELFGEFVLRSEPVLGYLHRMQEKMGEVKTPYQFLPNMGRVDYLNPIAWNWAYAGAVEILAKLEVPERAEYLRIITAELNRISSHLLWWGAFVMDLGGVTPILYAFEEREKINDIVQIVTGSRLTYNYFRFGGVGADADDRFFKLLHDFIPYMRERLKMYQALVTENIIFRRRLEGIGPMDADLCLRYGATGPILRAAGVNYDTRIQIPYGLYHKFKFPIPTGPENDCYGRYLVRIKEIESSLTILEQALDLIPPGPHLVAKAPKPTYKLPAGEAYFAVEGARGQVACHILSDGGKTPYRIKLRAPGFSNLSLFAEAAKGTILADAIAILGSLDLLIPEVDR
ncbi:MAG: NADH-quinone oxidoreductase subunit D [Deltaproteobacteria bacterium]|jgi:NADH-quinone oxidoreductase subunit D|nr:NADH-quinone oxidoreductase subunit D [Deltaproteobacteria bacterium]